MAFTVTHATAADGTFSTAGETAWEANHTLVGNAMVIGDTVEGGTATRVLFVSAGQVLDDSPDLIFNETSRLFGVGPSDFTASNGSIGAMIGLVANIALGNNIFFNPYTASTGVDSGLIMEARFTAQTSGEKRAAEIDMHRVNSSTTAIDGAIKFHTSSAGTLGEKMRVGPLGIVITTGTVTTDVAALSVTRTNNDAAVATGVKFTFTDTTSAAGFLPMQILGTSNGTTNLFSVSKTGGITTGVPAGGTAAAWKFGTVASVSPLVPNRTIELDVNGTIYYLHAKTTND